LYSAICSVKKGMHKGLLALGIVLILVGLFLTTFYYLPYIWSPSSYKSASPQTELDSEEDDTEPEVEQYVELQVDMYLKSEKWMRDYPSDLPIYEALIAYDVSNLGTAIAEDVLVTIRIDGAVSQQFSLGSLPAYASSADQFSVSINYDDMKHISLSASNQDSEDTDLLTISAVLARSYDSKVAKLYITPDDPLIEQTLEYIVKNPFIPDWIEIRDWVANNVEYRYDSVSHGKSEYWQLPRETLSLKRGDCEDFSILLTSLYRAIGWDESEVYVVLGEKNEEGHAWVKLNVDIIGWQNLEPQAGALNTIIGDFLSLSGFTAKCNFNDVYLFGV